MESDEPGFWERYHYHMYGDLWKEHFMGDACYGDTRTHLRTLL